MQQMLAAFILPFIVGTTMNDRPLSMLLALAVSVLVVRADYASWHSGRRLLERGASGVITVFSWLGPPLATPAPVADKPSAANINRETASLELWIKHESRTKIIEMQGWRSRKIDDLRKEKVVLQDEMKEVSKQMRMIQDAAEAAAALLKIKEQRDVKISEHIMQLHERYWSDHALLISKALN